jgi:DNA-binding NarL/FixJ family response regulator
MTDHVVRVLIADDHPIFREGLRLLLSTEADIEVVAEADTTELALDEVDRTHPDVVLLDVDMPDAGGLAALPRMLEAVPGLGVVMLTMMEDDATLAAALRAGARGYLLKGVGRIEVTAAVRAVATGGSAYGPGVADRVVERFLAGDVSRDLPLPELNARERQVTALVGIGLANPAIAQRLHLSPKTVRNLVSSAMGKLAAPDRTSLAIRARDAGLAGD